MSRKQNQGGVASQMPSEGRVSGRREWSTVPGAAETQELHEEVPRAAVTHDE